MIFTEQYVLEAKARLSSGETTPQQELERLHARQAAWVASEEAKQEARIPGLLEQHYNSGVITKKRVREVCKAHNIPVRSLDLHTHWTVKAQWALGFFIVACLCQLAITLLTVIVGVLG